MIKADLQNNGNGHEPARETITVVLADDHAVVRDGLRMLLQATGDIEVIGEAENGQQAVREVRRLQPHVVIMDIAMPVLNGIEAARQIAHEVPKARVLILSSYNDSERLRQAVEVGASGYLIKEAAGDNLVEAIRQARNGASFNPLFLSQLLKVWGEASPNARDASTRAAPLSWREAEVLQLIAEGYASKQIASVLSLAMKTIEKHRQTLMDKLNLHNIANLTRYAISAGVIESRRSPQRPLPLAGAPERSKSRPALKRARLPTQAPVSGLVRSFRTN